MDRQTECASEQTWRQFVAGGLAAPESDLLQAHAASCSSCGELVRRLRQSEASVPDSPSDAERQRAQADGPSLTKTKSVLNTRDGTPLEGHEFDLEAGLDASLLTAAVRPDSMGRLGKYDILEVLGQGAFGVVLKAFDEQLRRSV